MTAWKNILQLGFLGILILTIADPAWAQRGDGRGRSGQQGGQGGGRGGRSGGEFSGRPGSDARRSFSQGSSQRSSSERQSMRRTYRQSDRNDARSQVQSGAQQRSQRQGQGQRQRQESFFRGPDSDRSNTQQRDRTSSDNQRARDFDRNARNQFDGRQRDRDGGDADWRNRVFNDNRITGDGTRNESRANLTDRDNWSRTADRIRENWYRRDRDNLPFRYGWWDNAGVNRWPVLSPWRYSRWQDRPYYWWGWTPAPTLTNWLVFGWDRPYYWDYGPGGNIFYRDNYVYYDNQRYLADEQYYRQVHDLAHSVPSVDANAAQQMEWQPLGVFAATPGSESTQRTLQLAVNKNGVVSGTYYNPQNEHVHPLLGMVDERTQRAAWAFADGEHPDVVFETSIYNLTEQQSTMMVHFGPSANDTQIWRLVRLERPEATPSAQPGPQSTLRELP